MLIRYVKQHVWPLLLKYQINSLDKMDIENIFMSNINNCSSHFKTIVRQSLTN